MLRVNDPSPDEALPWQYRSKILSSATHTAELQKLSYGSRSFSSSNRVVSNHGSSLLTMFGPSLTDEHDAKTGNSNATASTRENA